ncbi:MULTISPECIES: Kdo hydroxylase family protein [Tatumella]|uniref:Kdo hydroxylase family protein n=1 Tax=Tatumella punctata TaxID=399969 RepID=A0ABW1VL61_9GAMM|nr:MULTISPECIES: Kdo hydroxylase family protein [unclassified Tatumella]MBS0855093.1 Kdo hydroxylase family protein [Tatumella sp. JGM16]MBS0876123.1 Kdo hydroxylase family protein [Tatumella sp. JGM82]MBS0889171.1 Kdo hydroxylase family protein [Tatumella sp. JGM94]MBS0892710.1 Kdo hydroxylase family protein [Tatumella sp. JGM130]MBS0901053.1 Kdo hydroxylase family protein [Tatumella sp. JGM100]
MQTDTLRYDDVIFTLPLNDWADGGSFSQQALTALEQGAVLSLPRLGFPLTPDEQPRLREQTVQPGRKNISYRAETDQLFGVADKADETVIRQLLQRHHQVCQQLIGSLLPAYVPVLHTPINTLRVHPVAVWKKGSSWRKDDTRLHVDAFPSRPIHGERILRIFTNINPHGEARVWRVGEPFPSLVKRFLPRVGRYHPLSSLLQQKLGITKSYRTRYDHIMLGLHDAMKADTDYQSSGAQLEVSFPPGSSWICFSDQTPHAAMSGQFMLEQTFLLPARDMVNPQHSPLKTLETLLGASLL